jgi:hypothetical protein
MAGKKVKCKHCGKVFAIPADATAQPEGEAGLSAMGADAQDTNTPAAAASKVGGAAGATAGGGSKAGGKLGSASAGYASRMARNENAVEIELSDGRPAYGMRPSVPHDFPGADVLEKIVPPLMILLGLGWLGLTAVTINETGVAWVGWMRAGVYLALSLGLAFPLGYWAIKHASRKERFMLPPKAGTRALGCTALAFALALVLWISGGSVGMLITGTVLGLVLSLAAVWFLFRLQPRELATGLGGVAVAVVAAVAISYGVLLGVNTVAAVALTKSGTNTLEKSPMGPGFAWNVPLAEDKTKVKAKKNVTIAIDTTQPAPTTEPGTETVTTSTSKPTVATTQNATTNPGSNATQVASTAGTSDAGTKPDSDNIFTSMGTGKTTKPPTDKGPETVPGPGATASNGTPGGTQAPGQGDKPLFTESPVVAGVTPVADLPSGTQVFFPPTGAGVIGALKRTTTGDEVVQFYTGNPPARSEAQVEPFVVEKKVAQNYVLSSNGETMARLTSFPLLGVQLVSTATGKEVKTLPLDATITGRPHLIGFGANDTIVILWELTTTAKNGIEVLNPKGTTPLSQRVTTFGIDKFEVTANNPVISPDGRQLAAATFVAGQGQAAGGIDLYELGPGLPTRRPRTLKVSLPKWTPPSGMAYGPTGQLAAYFELDGDGVMYHFSTSNPNPVHTHTFRGSRALTPRAEAAGGVLGAAVPFVGRSLEFVSPNEWLVFGRQLIDVETGKSLGEVGVTDARAQRVADKDTLFVLACDSGGREQLLEVKLKPDEIAARRNEVRGGKR